MKALRFNFFIICLITLSGCKGGTGAVGSLFDSNSTTPEVPASQIETVKLQEAIKADPIYKIEDSEIELLKNEGVLTEADIAELQAIQ